MGTHIDQREDTMPDRPLARVAAVCVLSMMLALTGCAVGPKFQKPDVTVNPEWSGKEAPQLATQAAPDTAWWRAFNDPTLDTLIAHAYQQNLTLQTAGVRIMESRAQLALASGRQWPQIQAAVGSATAIGISENLVNIPYLDRNFWDFQVGFDAVWELDFWGRRRNDVHAETAHYFESVADYDNALVTLTAEVARTYSAVRTYEVLIDLTRENVKLQEEGLRIATARFVHGATSELDVTQSRTLLQSTRARVPQLEISLQQSKNALSTLLGQPTGTIEALLAGPREIPSAPATVAVSVPAELLRRRPDVRASEFAAAAQSARVGVAAADIFPSFSLAGSIGSQTTSGVTPSTAGPLFGAGSLYYSAGPRFFWPLLNYGRTHNNVRIQDARYEQTLVQYESTVIRAAQEVEDGLTGFLKSQEAATYADSATRAAQRSAELAFVQYREGAVDFQRVLDAQRSLLQEQSSLAQTRSSIATNLIAVYKALGGGWELREGQPFVPDKIREEMQKRTNWGDLFKNPPAPEPSNSTTNH